MSKQFEKRQRQADPAPFVPDGFGHRRFGRDYRIQLAAQRSSLEKFEVGLTVESSCGDLYCESCRFVDDMRD